MLCYISVDHIPSVNRYLMYTPPSPAVEQRSYPSSRDSGCYASWEHIHNKNQLKFHPMHSNKENLFPEKFRGSDSAHVSSNNNMSSNIEKVESNYSEEDKEVFELIKNNLGDDSSEKGANMVTCSYAETQTSPCGSSNCPNNSKLQCHTTGGKTDQSVRDSQTPKTFVRKSVPRMGSVVRDAQVQVMSPLGSVPNDRHNFPNDAQRRKVSDSDNSGAKYLPSDAHRRILSDSNNSKSPSHNMPCYDHPKTRMINGSVSVSPSMGYRQVKKSLINLVASKLASESIDLSQEPYSNQVC